MRHAGVRIGVGTRFTYDGEIVEGTAPSLVDS